MNFSKDTEKALLNGALLAGFSQMVEKGSVVRLTPLGGTPIPIWAFAGGVGVAASYVSDAIHSWVLPHISQNQKYMTSESAILSPIISGAALSGGMYVGNKDALQSLGAMKWMGAGAASEAIATYVSSNIL